MYAVAAAVYKLYPFYIIMYDIGISLGAAATVYDAIAKPTKSNWKKHSSVMLVAHGVHAVSAVLLAQMRVADIVEGSTCRIRRHCR